MRKDLVGLITNFKSFRDSNENFEKKFMNSKMRKLQMYLEQVPKLQNEYNSLAAANFKVLEVTKFYIIFYVFKIFLFSKNFQRNLRKSHCQK